MASDRTNIVGNALSGYIANMFASIPGHKVLYLDAETSGIISQLLSQSDALGMDVFLITRLGAPHDKSDVGHLNACVFVRPTKENIELLKEELGDAKHQEFFLFFTNRLEDTDLHTLAEADKFEVVRSVIEFYADVYPVNRDIWTLNLPYQLSLYKADALWDESDVFHFARSIDGIISFLLATKKRPIVRYANSSQICRKLATAVHQRVTTERDLFDWQEPPVEPLLLILDRMEDPVTPLLLQWTYQAMLHELLTIENARVDLSNVPGANATQREVVFNPFEDENFRQWDTLNFGELGEQVQAAVAAFSSVANTRDLNSIDDLQRFVEKFPSLMKQKAGVSKHVTVLHEFGRLMKSRHLVDISELEQEISCCQNPRTHFDRILEVIRDPNLHDEDKLRLALIFALRYDRETDRLVRLRQALRENLRSEKWQNRVDLVDVCARNWAGMGMKSRQTFKKDFLTSISNFIRQGGLEGADMILAQHQCLLHHILESISRNKLPGQAYPSVSGRLQKQPPQDIIVFIVGGATFEEALVVRKMNMERPQRHSVVLGSGFVHNSRSFIEEIERVYGHPIA